MDSNGRHEARGFSAFAAAALGALAGLAIAASFTRIAAALHRAAERDAEREAELNEWANSDLPHYLP